MPLWCSLCITIIAYSNQLSICQHIQHLPLSDMLLMSPLYCVTFKQPQQHDWSCSGWPLLWQTWWQRVAGSWTDGQKQRYITTIFQVSFPLSLGVIISQDFWRFLMRRCNTMATRSQLELLCRKEIRLRRRKKGMIISAIEERIRIFNS